MPDRLQRCALPGCDAPIKQANGGGPRQKFCCAAHRVAARRLRHDDAATDLADKGTRLAPFTSVQLNIGEQAVPCPPKAPSVKVAAATAAAKAYRQQVAAAASRRKRAIAVLAAASVLSGGGGVVAFNQQQARPSGAALAGQGAVDAGQIDKVAWLQDAEQTRERLRQDLDRISQLKARFMATALARQGALPRAYQDLIAHELAVRNSLESVDARINSVRNAESSIAALAATEGRIADIDKKLAAQDTSNMTPEQRQTHDDLVVQRNELVKQRDAQQQNMSVAENSAQSAVSQPLPQTADTTDQVAQPVENLIDGSPAPDPEPQRRTEPPLAALTARDSSTQRVRQDTDTGAPPNRGRPGFLDPEGSATDDAESARGFGTGTSDATTADNLRAFGNRPAPTGTGMAITPAPGQGQGFAQAQPQDPALARQGFSQAPSGIAPGPAAPTAGTTATPRTTTAAAKFSNPATASTTPGSTTPGGTAPGSAPPGNTTADAGTPEAPAATVPMSNTTAAANTDTTAPDTVAADTTASDTPAPDTATAHAADSNPGASSGGSGGSAGSGSAGSGDSDSSGPGTSGSSTTSTTSTTSPTSSPSPAADGGEGGAAGLD